MPASSHLHKGNRYVLGQHCSQEDTGSRIRKREWVQTIKSHRMAQILSVTLPSELNIGYYEVHLTVVGWQCKTGLFQEKKKKLLLFLLSHFADHTRSKGQCSGTGLQDTRQGDKPQLVIIRSKFSDLITLSNFNNSFQNYMKYSKCPIYVVTLSLTAHKQDKRIVIV